MKEGKQKFEKNRRKQSVDSSSLQFLGTDNQDQENNMMRRQNNLNTISERRKREWQQPQMQKNQNGYKKRQKTMDDQTISNSESIFLYKPGVQLPNLFNFTNQTIKVIIAAQYITKQNPAYVTHKIYGTDTYSSNSDCVCIGIHNGMFNFNSFSTKKYEGAEITFKVIKPKKNYVGTMKNGLQSENMKNYNGNSLKPQSCKMLTSLGSMESLQRYAANMHVPIGKARIRAKPQRLSSIIPMPDSNLVFNMNNQPAYKYSIQNIADKGFQKSEYMIRKLDQKVLYVQTESKQRYELYKYVQKTYFEAYRFSKVKNPLKFDNEYFSNKAAPLENNDLQILQSLLQWDEIIFGIQFIRVKDRKISNLISFKYYSKQLKQ